jgi:anti-sigma factor RsiW
MMTDHAECRRVRELMDSYISGELTVESNHDVLAHLERCDGCRGEVSRRERMRALLIEGLGAAPDVTALQSRITRALDGEQRRRWTIARYGSLAAALLLMVGAALWWSRPVDAAAFDDSVDNHIACALTTPPQVQYDAVRIAQSLEPQYQSIVMAVAHRAGGYELVDAHMCPYQGRDYVHLVYRSGAHVLSVFSETASRGRLPATHEEPRKGFVTAGVSDGQRQTFVVSENAAPAPAELVGELLTSTMAFVRTLER